MTHPRCTALYRQALTPYLFGDLTPEQLRCIEEDLTCCASCSRDLEELRMTLDMLPAPESTVSVYDGQRLQARLTSGIGRSRRWHAPLITSACAVALVIFCLATPLVHNPPPHATGDFLSEPDVLENLEMLQTIDLLEELELLEALEARG